MAVVVPRHEHRRALLGLRRNPGRLALWVFRIPLYLYRRGWGWMLGETFLRFVHVGRRTGQRYEAVAMVLDRNRENGEVAICSGWGPDADWVRNLRAGSASVVSIAREQFVAEPRFLSDEEALSVGTSFRSRHPHRMRLISTILGWGDLRRDDALVEFVRAHPFVAFCPHEPDPLIP